MAPRSASIFLLTLHVEDRVAKRSIFYSPLAIESCGTEVRSRSQLMHAITRSTLPPSRLAVEGRGVSYIIESHVVTRARTTADLTRTVPNYRRAVEGERAPHTARP